MFISPVEPKPTGTGLNIRSHYVIKALSENYNIQLIIIKESLRKPVCSLEKPAFCNTIDHIGVWHPSIVPVILRSLLFRLGVGKKLLCRKSPVDLQYVTAGRVRNLKRLIADSEFHMVHLFRLRMAPFGMWIKAQTPDIKLHLDLDDLESVVHERFAELYKKRGNMRMATFHRLEAVHYRALERRWLPCFDNIYVCSELDREKVKGMYRLDKVHVVPNVMDIRPLDTQHVSPVQPFVFLFVGAFGYFPNHDGVSFFIDEILPRVREGIGMPFHLLLAGPDMPRDIRHSISRIQEIRYLGRIKSVEDVYWKSNAAIVPLRAGGGTRLKVLEAFSFSVPVISTRIGLEGLDVVHGEHAIIADTADEFANHCCRVAQDAHLRRRLITKAYQLVTQRYSPSACSQSLSAAMV